MFNPTMLQKISARLYIDSPSPNLLPDSGWLPVYELEGSNRLGYPDEYEVTAVSAVRVKLEELADKEAAIEIIDEKNPDSKRTVKGMVYEIKERSRVGDKHLYTVRIVHPLFYLGLTRRYEIYQDKSAYEIIDTLLRGYRSLLNIEFHTDIAPNRFIKREYTTQYAQSDLEFIQMLCEQEGITLLAKSDKSPFDIRICNINESAKECKAVECAYERARRFEPTHTHKEYYDFKHPSFRYRKRAGQKPLAGTMEDNGRTSRLRHDLMLMYHEDRVEAPRDKDLSKSLSSSVLEAYSGSEYIEALSQSFEAKAGDRTLLKDIKGAKETRALITAVRIEAKFPNALQEYTQKSKELKLPQLQSKIEASPIDTPFIPEYNIQKPRVDSALTAIVSAGREDTNKETNTIDIDEFGRVRVIFHFDPSYPTSCYIRFANFFAGDGWGSMFIPRVNTEVIVNFINGDPDRPVAVGSLYNAENKIPQSLPEHKTQSYIKTRSMPGSDREYNLLLFEDRQGEELVRIRAQKDYTLHALHDSHTDIDNDRTKTVGRDESETVGRDRTRSVAKDESVDIGQDSTKSVARDESVRIGNDLSVDVGRDHTLHVQRSRAVKIDRDLLLYTGNRREEKTEAHYTLKTGGDHSHTVGGEVSLKAGGGIRETTTVYRVDAGEIFTAKGAGGAIIVDGGGITLKGNVTIMGNVAISSGSPEAVATWSAAANNGDEICPSCMLKKIMEEG